MKLNLKDEPKEWRKSAWLALLGLALISSLLRWRHHLADSTWRWGLGGLAVLAILAGVRPRWFRGYHLLSMRLGYFLSQYLGRGLLILFFLLVITPVAIGRRWLGRDALQLKSGPNNATYWQPARPQGPLDRLF